MGRMEDSDKFGYPKPASALIALLLSSFAAARAYYPAEPPSGAIKHMPMSRYLWHCLCPWHRFPAISAYGSQYASLA